MSETISIRVPAKTTTCFVVATENEPGEAHISMRRRLHEPFATAVSERLGTSRLVITNYETPDSPWDLADVVADDEDQDSEARARKATHHIGITAMLSVSDQPFGGQVARAAARAVAEAVSGVVIDLSTNQILPDRRHLPDGAQERTRFVLADDWLGAWLPRDDGHCSEGDESVDGCTCIEFTTRGLRRFGLPELRIPGVACPHDLAALNVLRATAQRLLPMGRLPGEHSFSPDLPLTSADFAAYWGVNDPLWTDGPLPVLLTWRNPHLLTIGPPRSFQGSLNEWLWDELPPVMYELLGCTPDPLPT